MCRLPAAKNHRCAACVDVKRVGPAPGAPDQLSGNIESELTIEAPARVFHQGPGILPNMTGVISQSAIFSYRRADSHEPPGKQNMKI